MGIGGSVFLLAVGAILAFAVNATVAGLDIHVVGFILMAAGVIGLAVTLMVWGPRRRTVPPAAVVAEPAVVEERAVVRDRDIY